MRVGMEEEARTRVGERWRRDWDGSLCIGKRMGNCKCVLDSRKRRKDSLQRKKGEQ